MKGRRAIALAVAAVLATAAALYAQTLQAPARSYDLNIPVISAFVATWIGMVLSFINTRMAARRDEATMQDRVDKRTREVVADITGSTDWSRARDERIREVTRLLLYDELEYDVRVIAIETQCRELKDRVEALSRRVGAIPDEIRNDIKAAVRDGVAEAAKGLAADRLKGMIFPDGKER